MEMIKGRWYLIKTQYRYLILFDRLEENGDVLAEKAYILEDFTQVNNVHVAKMEDITKIVGI